MHDTVTFEVPVIVEKNVTRDTVSHLENEWAKSDAELTDGFLWHTLETKGHTVYVPVTTMVRDTVIVEKESQTITVVEEVEKPLTWWQRFRINAFFWLLLAVLSCFLWIFRKPFLSVLKEIFL